MNKEKLKKLVEELRNEIYKIDEKPSQNSSSCEFPESVKLRNKLSVNTPRMNCE